VQTAARRRRLQIRRPGCPEAARQARERRPAPNRCNVDRPRTQKRRPLSKRAVSRRRLFQNRGCRIRESGCETGTTNGRPARERGVTSRALGRNPEYFVGSSMTPRSQRSRCPIRSVCATTSYQHKRRPITRGRASVRRFCGSEAASARHVDCHFRTQRETGAHAGREGSPRTEPRRAYPSTAIRASCRALVLAARTSSVSVSMS
jgi:hypothetical protein